MQHFPGLLKVTMGPMLCLMEKQGLIQQKLATFKNTVAHGSYVQTHTAQASFFKVHSIDKITDIICLELSYFNLSRVRVLFLITRPPRGLKKSCHHAI